LQTSNDYPPPTPIPDYDSTPQNTIVRVNGQHNNPLPHINNSNGITIITQKYANNDGRPIKGTMGRIAAASELARAASAEAAELESIESYKMTTPASTTPRPPSVYFAPQKSGPPTMKKSNKSVSVTIGEYGGGTLTRKEPHKFDFITKPGSDQNEREYDVTTQLKHELEKTLSRSNLKKRSDSMVSDGRYGKYIVNIACSCTTRLATLIACFSIRARKKCENTTKNDFYAVLHV
jgi:hypothetical protein